MEEDIDIGKYLGPIFRHYTLGLVLFAIVAVIIVGVQLLRPASFTATNTLFVQSPQYRYQWRFDQRLAPSVNITLNWQKKFVDLSGDTWVHKAILQKAIDEGGEELEGTVTVSAGKENIIFVKAKASSPAMAALLANRWTQAYIDWIDWQYGTKGLIAPFQQQLAQSGEAFRQKEEAVRVFTEQTGVGVVTKGQSMLEGYEWLGALGVELSETNRLLAQHQLAISHLDILGKQIGDARSAGTPMSDLSWELLNVPAIVDRGYFSLAVVQSLFDQPDQVAALIEVELAAQKTSQAALQARVNEQLKLAADYSLQYDRLVDERSLAKENYQMIVRQLDELAMQGQVEGVGLTVLEPAKSPASPTPIGWTMVALLALVVGGVIGVAGCYVAEFMGTRAPRA